MAKRELGALTGLRGIAALWVLACHLTAILTWQLSDEERLPFKLLSIGGYLGVDLFFVLSGFVLAYNYCDASAHSSWRNYFDFLWRRLARIYPVHVSMLALMTVLATILIAAGVSFDDHRFTANGLLRSLLLTQAWSWPIGRIWNDVSWSISAEWAAYLAFPLLAVLLRYIREPRVAVLLIFSLMALLIYLVASGPWSGSWQYGMVRIACEFPAGMLLYRLWALKGFVKNSGGYLACIALAIFIAATNVYEATMWNTALTLFPLFVCPLIYWLTVTSDSNRLLSSPLMLTLGRWSYSIYLLHFIVLWFAENVLLHVGLMRDKPSLVGAAILSILITMLGASLIYRYIEEPCRRWLIGFTKASNRLSPQPI